MRMADEERKGRSRKRTLREDTALHPQSSVRLHMYWVHGRVAGIQVNMTYEYCRSYSLALCPPQLLMSGLELAQLSLEALFSHLLKTISVNFLTEGPTVIKKTGGGSVDGEHIHSV